MGRRERIALSRPRIFGQREGLQPSFRPNSRTWLSKPNSARSSDRTYWYSSVGGAEQHIAAGVRLTRQAGAA